MLHLTYLTSDGTLIRTTLPSAEASEGLQVATTSAPFFWLDFFAPRPDGGVSGGGAG